MITLEIEDEVAKWLKQVLESYLVPEPWKDRTPYLQAKLNCQYVISKIILAESSKK